jgi:ElaB/YqjD/DUF883 family membrane-anchored ribosome-binding protein
MNKVGSSDSVDALRKESERTRAALAGTVTELRERVSDSASEIRTMISPAHIKHEIRSFVREERDSLRQSLERKIKDNPLQAAAIGAALAYPAMGLLRAIPVPLYLIGAGLFLTSSRGKATLADATAKAGDLAGQGVAAASSMAADARHAVAERTEPLTRTLQETWSAVTEQAGAMADGIRRNVHDLRDVASDTVSKVAGMPEGASREASPLYRDARDKVRDTAQRTQSTLMQWVDQNPLAVAGIGAAIGAFIAAALPPSSGENALMGKSSDHLKDKAQKAAAQGLQKVTGVATNIAADAQAAAAREGLDADGLKAAANTVTDGIKAVAERGLQTALNGDPPPDNPAEATNAIPPKSH